MATTRSDLAVVLTSEHSLGRTADSLPTTTATLDKYGAAVIHWKCRHTALRVLSGARVRRYHCGVCKKGEHPAVVVEVLYCLIVLLFNLFSSVREVGVFPWHRRWLRGESECYFWNGAANDLRRPTTSEDLEMCCAPVVSKILIQKVLSFRPETALEVLPLSTKESLFFRIPNGLRRILACLI